MTTNETLRVAKKLYWTAPAHPSAYGYPTEGTYCAITAIILASQCTSHPDREDRLMGSAFNALRLAAGGVEDLAIWNASVSTREVLTAFDKAIEATS